MEPMGRICPFLALAADHRTVVDGYDPDHRCHAVSEPDPLDRTRQLQLCLTEAHRGCERFVAALELKRAEGAPPSPVAPDARIPRTRLVLDPAGVEAPAGGARRPMGSRARRALLAAVAALVGVLVLVSGVVEGLVGLVAGPTATPMPSVAASPAAGSSTPVSSADATPVASTVPTAAATLLASTPTPAPPAGARSYTVRRGDTLVAIAEQFGTSVQAIQQANGLGDTDVINIGQVLVIP
jgi:LysM repeat protein